MPFPNVFFFFENLDAFEQIGSASSVQAYLTIDSEGGRNVDCKKPCDPFPLPTVFIFLYVKFKER